MLYAKKDIYAIDAEGRRFQVALAGQPVPARSVRYVDKADVTEEAKPSSTTGRARSTTGNAGVIPPEADLNATEAAVELAKENSIDLTTVKGTGKDGRIIEGDVQKLVDASSTKE